MYFRNIKLFNFMAEHEVAKHTKKAYKVLSNSDHNLFHKLKEFFVEIFIIVFAVSISIWFHNLSEKSHDREEAVIFLTGLKGDLIKDIEEMRSDTISYSLQYNFFKNLYDSSQYPITSSYIDTNRWLYSNSTVLVPNISRFEALKYSGKMNTIENKELLDEIINLYEEKIPRLVEIGNDVSDFKNDLISDYFDNKMLYSENNKKLLLEAIKTDERLRYIFQRIYKSSPYVIAEYKKVIEQNQQLIGMIEEDLK
jgi:hypothetical protein